jgi:hypothetical protein
MSGEASWIPRPGILGGWGLTGGGCAYHPMFAALNFRYEFQGEENQEEDIA